MEEEKGKRTDMEIEIGRIQKNQEGNLEILIEYQANGRKLNRHSIVISNRLKKIILKTLYDELINKDKEIQNLHQQLANIEEKLAKF